VRLYYQQTSWEYVQFLWKGNDRQNTFLANEGVNLLDAWLNTGQAAPLQLSLATANVTPPAAPPGEASHQTLPNEQMRATYNRVGGQINVTYTPACDSSNHNIYYGDLAGVSSYSYTGAACNVGISGSASFAAPGSVFERSHWADANVFWDATNAIRFGLEYAWFRQYRVNGDSATDNRVQFSAFYLF
jgi:hypothetical protein